MKVIWLWELDIKALADGPVLVRTPGGDKVRVRRLPWVGKHGSPFKRARYETSIGNFHTMTQLTRELAKV